MCCSGCSYGGFFSICHVSFQRDCSGRGLRPEDFTPGHHFCGSRKYGFYVQRPPVIANVNSGHAMIVATSLAASSGTLRLPAFVSTFPSVPAITDSNSSRPEATFTSPVTVTYVTGAFSALDGPVLSPSFDKAFVVGPGHAPIPANLVSKIISRQFLDLADLLSANLRSVEHEPQTFWRASCWCQTRAKCWKLRTF